MASFVAVLEQLSVHGSIGANDHHTWMRKKLFLRVLVLQAKRFDCCTVWVSQQWEGDRSLFSKLLKLVDRVRTEADNLEIGVFELLGLFLQLNQLPLAEGSPLGRSKQDQSNGAGLQHGLNGNRFSQLVLQRDRRNLRSDLDAG